MEVAYGRRCQPGALTVFSVGTEAEARALLVLTCPINKRGAFVAEELVRQQTLENLDRFSDRLAAAHAEMVKSGQCHCHPIPHTKEP